MDHPADMVMTTIEKYI